MRIFGSLYLLGFLVPFICSGQAITGRIIDEKNQEPLPFATIVLESINRGTVSNIEGEYVLDASALNENDTIRFSFVGYETLKITLEELAKTEVVEMKTATVNLKEVQVLSRQLSAKDIVELVYENFDSNHPSIYQKEKVFYHAYERTPFPDENQIIVKKTDFPGLDENTIAELRAMLPDEFVEYRDAQVELYSNGSENKLVPIEGITLEEGSQKLLQKQMEVKLEEFMLDIEDTKDEEGVYYKFRSGIFAGKADFDEEEEEKDSTALAEEKDSLNYYFSSGYVKGEILNLKRKYADAESKNWAFVNSTGRYKYNLDEVTVFNDELVYKISFIPKNRGDFEGVMYVTTDKYAVIQVDFQYANGKQTEKFQLLGIGHAMNFKKGSVIFEKRDTSYFVKYIYAEQHETASIERKFSIMKKQERFLFDKELNEIKVELQLSFDMNNYWEVLVLDHEPLTEDQYEKVTQPKKMKFRKEYVYSPEMWSNMTVIAPTTELKKYKRKQAIEPSNK